MSGIRADRAEQPGHVVGEIADRVGKVHAFASGCGLETLPEPAPVVLDLGGETDVSVVESDDPQPGPGQARAHGRRPEVQLDAKPGHQQHHGRPVGAEPLAAEPDPATDVRQHLVHSRHQTNVAISCMSLSQMLRSRQLAIKIRAC